MTLRAPLKLAIVGGRRGKSFARELRAQRDVIDVVAVCTRTPETVERWRSEWATDYPSLRAFTEYTRLLDESDCDAVLLATPMTVHAEQSIAALRAGKHVLSEVVAATTLDEGWALIEGVRAAGNYAVIFDVSAPNSGIVTADKSLDLTQRVIQQLKSGS